jgi:UDP-glucuronate 4-epimerase
MRYVVTGGVGFIGYHVCRGLLEAGHEVDVIDDFSDAPYPTAEKRRNAADLRAFADARPANSGAKLAIHEACVTDHAAIAPHFARASAVIHLAGLAGVRPSFDAPARYARVNVEGTANILELSRASGIQRVLFASSSSVYGNSTPLPAREDAAAVDPESPYAASKRGAELVAAAICKRAPALRCTALRFFTVYGPRQRPEMAITLFMRKILARHAITMFGDGSMRRDFTHVDDIARGVLAALEHAPEGFRAYNLGSGAPVDLSSLVSLLGETAGIAPIIERAAIPTGDVDATFADVARARDELGWSPRILLRDGLATVLAWVREHA